MSSMIDWLSFSLQTGYDTSTDEGYKISIENAFFDTLGLELSNAIIGGTFEPAERSRAPYQDAWKMEKRGMMIFASRTLNHMTVEFSGVGCRWLDDNELTQRLLHKVAQRVTRIDIATDIETSIAPMEFVDAGHDVRFKTSGIYKSETGETCYIGSQKSERFARVYKYKHPHPRAGLLRVEHVFRRDYAKQVAASLLTAYVSDVAAAAGKAFGWKHPLWQLAGDEDTTITPVRAERGGGGTVTWMVKSVAPAFRRLVKEGVIVDPQAFLQAYFMTDDDTLSLNELERLTKFK